MQVTVEQVPGSLMMQLSNSKRQSTLIGQSWSSSKVFELGYLSFDLVSAARSRIHHVLGHLLCC